MAMPSIVGIGWGSRPKQYALCLLAVIFCLARLPVEARNLQFEQITTEDGLSQSAAMVIAQDDLGYVWIGTQEGLNRYDGYEFKVFEHDASDENSLPDDWIWSLLVDHKGQLWVGTNDGGLSRYDADKDNFVNYQHIPGETNSLNSNQVGFILEDSQHFIWMASNGGGLSRLDPETGIFKHYRHDPADVHSLPSNSVNVVYEGTDGTLWIGTESGIAAIDESRNNLTRRDFGGTYNIRAISEYQGNLWLGTHSDGLKIFNPIESEITEYKHQAGDSRSLPSNLVREFLVDHQGSMWIATDAGLAQWQAGQRNFESHINDPLNPHSLLDARVHSLFQDSGNVLWVGTYGGVSRWNYVSDAFQNYHSGTNHLTKDIVTVIAENKSGELWIGTYGGGLNRLIPAANSTDFYQYAPVPVIELEDQRIMALAVDEHDTVWIGTRTTGLYRLEPDTGEVAHFTHDPEDEFSLSTNSVSSIYATDDSVWIGTYGGGLNLLHVKTGKFSRYMHDSSNPNSLGSDKVLSIYKDFVGDLWIGTEGGGLNRFNPLQKSFSRFMHDANNPASISSNSAWEIVETIDGSLWIGTLGSGLNRWSAENRREGKAIFQRFTKSDGLKSDTIFGILEGEAGRIWLSGNRGLTEFRVDTGKIRHFDQRNGIRGNDFNHGTRLRTKSGLLIFGGTSGLVAFDPKLVQLNTHSPTVVVSANSNTQNRITNYSGRTLAAGLTLGYTDRFVDFRFTALDFTSPDKNQYRYKLEGFEDEWTDPGQFRRATYTNLPSGNYKFRVRASNNDGEWSQSDTVVPVTVIPPPWLNIWAYAAYVLLLGGIILSYVLVQRRKLSSEARVRIMLEEKVKTRTQELGQRNQDLEIANIQLTHASMTDALTGLHNRHYLYDYLESQIASLNRLYSRIDKDPDSVTTVQKEGSIFFMMIDLDGFKIINDTYGHAAGDEALIQVRDVLRESTRDADTIVRWGGDEFLVVGDSESLEGAEHLAERIRMGLAQHDYLLGGGKVGYLTGSIGIAHFPFNPHQPRQFTWEQVVGLADQAAYVAKYNGRNAWVSFSGNEGMEQSDLVLMKDSLSSVVGKKHITMTTSIDGDIELDFASGIHTVTAKDLRIIR